MGLGKRDIHVGVVREEKGVIVLDTETGGPALEITLNGFNPEADRKTLEVFIGKRVSIDGIAASGLSAIFASASDIKELPEVNQIIDAKSLAPKKPGGPCC